MTIAVRLPSDSTRRLGSAALVLLLHLLLLLGLLRTVTQPAVPPRATAREIFLHFLPRLKSAPARQAAPPAAASPQLRSRAVPAVPPIATAPPPSLSGIGQNLFGCAPENLGNLSPEQRAHCTNGLTRPDDTVLAAPPSHVKDPARRAAEMATRNRPGRIPCTYVTAAPAPYGGTTPAPMAQPFCVLDGLLNGFGPLNGLEH